MMTCREFDTLALVEQVDKLFPKWRVGSATLIATGLESAVFRLDTALGAIALKVPFTRYINNDNDQGLDARDLLRQDALVAGHLRDQGFPAPEVIAVHFSDTLDFLAYRFVEADQSTCSAETAGRLVRQLHDASLPDFLPVAHRQQVCVELVMTRLTQERLRVIQRISGCALPQITPEKLLAGLTGHSGRRSLLHMDVRPANLLCAGGEVKALIDWSNALIGNPLFELTRMVEYDWPLTEVNRGYGRDVFTEAPAPTVLAAGLYTAVMLAVVFLSEAPDSNRAEVAVERVQTLIEEFAAVS